MTQSGHAFAAQQFPKGQLTVGTPGRPLVAAWEWPVAPIIPFEPSTGRGEVAQNNFCHLQSGCGL